MFSKLLCIVNKSSYKNEELKLHQSLLGVKGGGGPKQPSFQHLDDKLNKYSSKMYINIVHFLSKLFFWRAGAENNPVRSSISDQCYFHAKYDKNASTRACFLKIY